MKKLSFALIALSFSFLALNTFASDAKLIIGAYELPKMKSIKPLTLPRLHLYDANGKLVDRSDWPKELSSLKATAGDAFCCISDSPSPPGHQGPPPNCKKIVYGENRDEHFKDLFGKDHRPITFGSMPKHSYLLVEYFADWCSPCLSTRRELEKFLSSSSADGYATLVIDFSKLAPAK